MQQPMNEIIAAQRAMLKQNALEIRGNVGVPPLSDCAKVEWCGLSVGFMERLDVGLGRGRPIMMLGDFKREGTDA